MSKFIISCGGTGGHLAPGVAVAERLEEAGHSCWLVISRKEVDSRLIQAYPNLNSVSVPGSPFSIHPVRFARDQIALLIFAFRFIRRERPDAVVAFGGFITAGFTLVAFCHRIAVILHESNRKPGRAIRLLSPLANRLYLPEGVSLNGVPPQVTRHFGFPLRRNLQLIPRDRARKKLGIDNSGKFVVVLGGSQGSQALNDWFSDHLESLAHEGINVYCLTGLGKGESGETKFTSAHGRRVKGIRRTFTDRMGELLSAADLVVSRAGAGTIAEIAHCRVPSILVPFPYAADGHQLANARFLECQGGCIVVEESHIGELHSEVMDLIFNDWTLAKFRHNLTNLERGDYCERIVRDIEQIVIDRQNALTTPHRRTQVPA